MVIDVYSDVVCPWCYIGGRRLEKALALRPDLQVERRWRPFQLSPDMPKAGMAWAEFAQRKFGGWNQAQAIFARVTAMGAADGITLAFDRVASAPNTVDAHRLILFAAARGRRWETADALFRAYFVEGKDLNDHEQLVVVASGVGLEASEVRGYLSGEDGVAEVLASQEEAGRLGIAGVPFYVFDGRYALSGAQPVEVFGRALDAAASERIT